MTALRPYLEQAGHRLQILPLPRYWWHRLRLFRDLRRAEVVILQRKLLQPWQLYVLRHYARCLIFDFDDAIFLRDSYASKGLHDPNRLRRFSTIVSAVDAVAAGNDFLGQQALIRNARALVHIVPTCVDPGRYPGARHARNLDGVQLVWIGSSSTLLGVEAIRPWLEQIGEQHAGLQLKLICNSFLQLRNMPVVNCLWSEATEAAELAAADIGISWLPDDPWSQGKCGLKVLQYMAAGLPVVANPVGIQTDMVRHGETGYLADTPAQWSEAIGRLAREPALRRQMGEAGRRRVETDFSVAAGAARWNALLTEIHKSKEAA
jgi:glycosyltransferase involved in cell wall biosynthesis